MSWGGEYEAMTEANESVISRFPIALLAMVIATLILFGSFRQMLVIWMTVPLIIVGVFTIIVTYVLIKVVSLITPLRVDEETETNGLDLSVHGERAYDVNS